MAHTFSGAEEGGRMGESVKQIQRKLIVSIKIETLRWTCLVLARWHLEVVQERERRVERKREHRKEQERERREERKRGGEKERSRRER